MCIRDSGVILGGRFVSGFSGEQYASPEAAQHLDRVRSLDRTGVVVAVNACDPANLTGVITPGERIAAKRNTTIRFVDGLPNQVICGQDPPIFDSVAP